ncbi:hypothetical protein OHA61_17275 [Streptomyces sp. NBC_00885]|uniref:hypothetical protein n=1 Tax=Streptomyces sp. NBC_00885 TaxID=2975857 RepID=UPI00386570EC|nr:hypothetical protein OHA61_17275 [Streptomyces sp. NBC_00885]
MQAVRLDDDVEWVMDPDNAGARARQLLLIFNGMAVPNAMPLKKSKNGGRREMIRWKQKWAASDAIDRDDPAVLPPTVRGQQALFPMKRTSLSIDTARRVLARPLEGYEAAVAEAAVFAREYSLSDGWVRKIAEMIHLALAIRDAEGHDLVPEEALDELPNFWTAVGKILSRAGMLRTRQIPAPPRRRRPPKTGYVGTPPPPPPPTPRSCRDCDAWLSGVRRQRCTACQGWHGKHKRPAGRCERCHREGLPLKGGRCRGCCLHVYLHGPDAEAEPFTQLWIADPLAAGLWIPRGQLGYKPSSDHIERARRIDERRAARSPLVPQLAVPGQEVLFTTRRDWTSLLNLDRRVESLPEMTESARRLADEFTTMMRDQQWDMNQRVVNGRTLTILLSWLGADAPVLEADVVELSRQDVNLSAKRVCQFLKSRGMLVEDPDLHRDRDLEWIEQALAKLPEQIATEVRAWVTVLRGQGRREHEARGYGSIRRYFSGFQSVLEDWIADGLTSLREISHDDVKKAVGDHQGYAARYRHGALRSLFRALRQEQLVFQNPTRGVVVGAVKTLPPSIPSDVLAGLLDHATSAAARLVLALVAVHGLPGHEVCHLLTEDLSLSKGRLIVRRGLRRHTVYLEEFTHRLAAEWTAERHRRWPGSTSPYLLVSQQTAMDPDHPPITTTMLKRAVQQVKLSLSELRQDRILHEAKISADPLRLMRLFGISDTTAMRYISAAHPERTAKLPR